ncbi:MAG: hypothetical protein ACSLEZ_05755 [Thiobacillus sp.]
MLAVLFAGVALMLYAVTGGGHWLLWAVPAAALLTAIIAAWQLARAKTVPSFPRVAGAAIAGAWLIRGRPWRVLGGSVLVGFLARQALAMSLSSGGLLLGRLSTATRSRQASHPPL